jgi:hypothetical protein
MRGDAQAEKGGWRDEAEQDPAGKIREGLYIQGVMREGLFRVLCVRDYIQRISSGTCQGFWCMCCRGTVAA